MKYVALFGSSALVTAAMLGYIVFAHGERLLGGDRVPAAERPATGIADGCMRGAYAAGRVEPADQARFCACYGHEILNHVTARDLKAIESGVTYRFEIRAERASQACRQKLSLAQH